MKAPDFLIIGGGLIGLSIAWQIARRGAAVTVLDAGKAGMASRAAAGMLAPLAEAKPGEMRFVKFGVKSLLRYPEFLETLAEESGLTVPIAGSGTFRLVMRFGDNIKDARAVYNRQKNLGLPLEWLNFDAAQKVVPALPLAADAAIYSPSERQISPRPLHASLLAACERTGVTVRATSVIGFETDGAKVIGARTTEGAIPCGHAVLAAGAWSKPLAEMLHLHCPVTPIKGQILALGPRLPLLFTHTIYLPQGYVVPRDDGRVIVGATEEDTGFDTANSALGVARLLDRAMLLCGYLHRWPIDEIWTGLRPVSPDGHPLLGPVASWDNVSLATGHGRNGVLLTPITADLMVGNLLDRKPIPKTFDSARFGEAA